MGNRNSLRVRNAVESDAEGYGFAADGIEFIDPDEPALIERRMVR
jgi:hypothetical protein